MAYQFRKRVPGTGAKGFVSKHVKKQGWHSRRSKVTPECRICKLPNAERVKVDWLILSGYFHTQGAKEHIEHMGKDIVASSKFRDGSYGDELLGKVEWALKQMEQIAMDMRRTKPRIALLALKSLGDLASTQAKLIGLGVPRASGKNSLHLHIGNDLKTDDLSRAIDAFQRTKLNAPGASAEVEVVVEEPETDD